MDPGTVVAGLRGSYRIEARHAAGSFGVTYRAVDVASGAPVIVKELRIERLEDWKALELFEREGKVLAELSHANIPAFRDFFTCGAKAALPVSAMSTYAGPERLALVLVQEFIAGTTLQQRLDQGRRMAPGQAATVLRALLGALRYLHEHDPPLVHRDIKPGNVILRDDGRPYLVDFGAIQDRLRAAGSVGSTIVGTLGYMPVEQARGQARPASDLYALGVTLIVALAGRSVDQLPVDESTGKIDVLRALPPEVPGFVREALDGMVALLVAKRTQSAADALAQLDAARRSHATAPRVEERAEPPRPPPPPVDESPVPDDDAEPKDTAPSAPASPKWRRPANAVAIAAGVLVVLSGGVALVELHSSPPKPPSVPASVDDSLDVPQDDPKKVKAASDCRSGIATACEGIGKDWERAGNMVRAMDAYRRACDAGYLEMCTRLASKYRDSRDRAHAVALYTKACDRGEEHACGNLASMEGMGRSARKGERLAVQGDDVVSGATVDACYFAAKDQNGKACVALGVAYEGATPPDLRRAADAYLWACGCDHDGAEGCRRYADAIRAGRGVKVDEVVAAQWHERGCTTGDAPSCAIVGELAAKGKSGQTRDPVKAASLYKKACDGGASEGCALLGEMLEKGTGIDSNAARAVALYRQSCDAGSARGCNDLGLAYASGKGVDRDTVRAVALLKKTCDGGGAGACESLAAATETGSGVPRDPSRAAQLFRQACNGGDAPGCTRLGAMLEAGEGVTRDAGVAMQVYQQACDGDDVAGCERLAALYDKGVGGPADPTRAVTLYQKACDAGDARVCSTLGQRYEKGSGVPSDRAHAVDLYRLGCKRGDASGCAQLKRLGESI